MTTAITPPWRSTGSAGSRCWSITWSRWGTAASPISVHRLTCASRLIACTVIVLGCRHTVCSSDANLVVQGDLTSQGGYLATERLLSLPEPPTAIACVDDSTAIGVLHAAREVGCTVGKDLAVAELSCGFNRQTKISPVHAAQMVSSVLNKGSMVTPRLVRSEEDEHIQAMSEEAARNLAFMMERTARSGTVAKAFRHIDSDKVLRDLTIGGKSGSIDGDEPQGRRNWFVGYAQNRTSNEAITIGCLLIRNGYFWIEADTLSRLVMRYYFSRQLDVAQTTKRGAKPKT